MQNENTQRICAHCAGIAVLWEQSVELVCSLALQMIELLIGTDPRCR